MNAATDFDCIVVGAGPTGTVLAALLGQRGYRVLVVERDAQVYPLPRAVHLDHEIARVLQQVGVLDRLLPSMSPVTEYRFQNAAGDVLLHNVVPLGEAVSGWAASYMFVQPELEQALRTRLGEIGGVTTRFDCACIDLRQDSDGVEVDVRDWAGDVQTVRGAWLVGCDGASSFVRGRLGVVVEDLGFDEPWVVIDTKTKADIGLPDTIAYQFCDPARPTTCVPAGPGRRRWEFMLLPGETREAIVEPESVRRLLEPWGGEDALEIVRVAVYRFHALLARRWRVERVLLAGDAAHQMPPFMGQGLCSGVRDAANLAWKLDLVLRGNAPEWLLDTYQAERAPHVRQIVETSVAMGRIVCVQDADRAAERDAFMIDARRRGQDSLGRGQGGQAALLERGIVRSGTPGAGKLFPQPSCTRAGRSGRLDDLVGTDLRLVVAGGFEPKERPRATVVSLGCGEDAFVETAGPKAAAWLAEHGAVAALVRPDHYVYGTAATAGAAAELVDSFWSDVTNDTSSTGE